MNGAGKTTTIKMLSCLTKPTGGDALVGGYSITKEPEQVKRLIGVSPQETAVAPNLSVNENLELICGIHSFSQKISLGITPMTNCRRKKARRSLQDTPKAGWNWQNGINCRQWCGI